MSHMASQGQIASPSHVAPRPHSPSSQHAPRGAGSLHAPGRPPGPSPAQIWPASQCASVKQQEPHAGRQLPAWLMQFMSHEQSCSPLHPSSSPPQSASTKHEPSGSCSVWHTPPAPRWPATQYAFGPHSSLVWQQSGGASSMHSPGFVAPHIMRQPQPTAPSQCSSGAQCSSVQHSPTAGAQTHIPGVVPSVPTPVQA